MGAAGAGAGARNRARQLDVRSATSAEREFELNRLGSIVRKYKVDLYGVSDSPLHGGVPTDRFEAEWHLKSQRVVTALGGEWDDWPGWEKLPRANRTSVTDDGLLRCDELDLEMDVEALLVEFPKTITDLMAQNRKLALDWRFQTRKLFQEYFEKGYRRRSLAPHGVERFLPPQSRTGRGRLTVDLDLGIEVDDAVVFIRAQNFVSHAFDPTLYGAARARRDGIDANRDMACFLQMSMGSASELEYELLLATSSGCSIAKVFRSLSSEPPRSSVCSPLSSGGSNPELTAEC